MKLERAEIERLRGIPAGWPAIEIGEKGLIVYGPNGVGKSSIIDAIEATIVSRSSLFQEIRQGVNWETASEHLRGGPPRVVLHGIGQRLASLGAGKQQAQQLTNASLLLPLYEQALEAADELHKELTISEQRVPISLLTAAREHIHASPAEACPVCEQAFDPKILLQRLDQRILADEAVRLAAETLPASLA